MDIRAQDAARHLPLTISGVIVKHANRPGTPLDGRRRHVDDDMHFYFASPSTAGHAPVIVGQSPSQAPECSVP